MLDGARHLSDYLTADAQVELRDAIRAVVADAPLFTPTMPRTGKPLSVRMTNCGPLGWVTDKTRGYRYQPTHPDTARPWPAIPDQLLSLWHDVTGGAPSPDACLVNFYEEGARMGLHVDRDEETFDAPVVSVSLGDDAWFRVGGLARRDPTERIKLRSGDVFVLGGAARLAYHGIDRTIPGSSRLLAHGGRINLTLRRVRPDTSTTADKVAFA
ncbi:MAG: alpha-ketoglutarate-dependent dioxygenase AlkB [Pseudomonadota bacterium]